jgi:acetyl esterase/lipase
MDTSGKLVDGAVVLNSTIASTPLPSVPMRSLPGARGFSADGLVRRAAIARGVAMTVTKRLLHGPRHPSWPLPFELTMGLMRSMLEVDHHGAALAQRKRPGLMPPMLLRKIRLSHERLGGVAVDVHTPTTFKAGDPTLLYMHGGGYVTCSPSSHRHLLATLASLVPARVVAPAYRLAPEHPFPAALDDVCAVYAALLSSGMDPSQLFLGGDSAGGGLAVGAQLRMRDGALPIARGLILMSPWIDLSLGYEALLPHAQHDFLTPKMLIDTALKYAGKERLDHPLISPVHADLKGLPPMLVLTGAWELFYEQNCRFVARAQEAGVDVHHQIEPGMLHAYPAFSALLPQARAALRYVAQYVRTLSRASAP